LQNLPVLFALDRSGLVGADGATHAGAYDIAYLRCIPNMVVLVPSDEDQCRRMLSAGFAHDGPVAVRYPRGAGVGAAIGTDLEPIEIGKGEIRRQSQRKAQLRGGAGRVAILAFGTLLHPALVAAQSLDATVVDMRCVKPIDRELLRSLAADHDALITLEEHAIFGGAGSACAEALTVDGILRPVLMLGLPDRFIDHGDHQKLLAAEGLDAGGIERSIRSRFGEWVEPLATAASSGTPNPSAA
jgi:1-deoxy-D-xylulose-5-phosphate synthase